MEQELGDGEKVDLLREKAGDEGRDGEFRCELSLSPNMLMMFTMKFLENATGNKTALLIDQ